MLAEGMRDQREATEGKMCEPTKGAMGDQITAIPPVLEQRLRISQSYSTPFLSFTAPCTASTCTYTQ